MRSAGAETWWIYQPCGYPRTADNRRIGDTRPRHGDDPESNPSMLSARDILLEARPTLVGRLLLLLPWTDPLIANDFRYRILRGGKDVEQCVRFYCLRRAHNRGLYGVSIPGFFLRRAVSWVAPRIFAESTFDFDSTHCHCRPADS